MRKSVSTSCFSALFLFSAIGAMAQSQTFSTVGTSDFTVPASVLAVKVECVGGGGAGGRVTPSNAFDTDASGGGGGGAYASALVPVTAGNLYPVTVGAGGFNTGTSGNGGDSYFADGTVVKAAGGLTRSGNDNEAGVDGGQAANSLGTVVFSGGKGGNGDEGDADGGGGGGAAGSTGNGFDGGQVTAGAARPNLGGNGGPGGADGANGQPGGNFGGGGGGSSANGSNDRNGGPGASGVVVVTWCTISTVTPSSACGGSNQTIQIKGTNFGTVDSVVFGNQSVTFNAVSDTLITVNASSLNSGGQIRVYSQNGISQSATSFQFVSNTVSTSVNGMTIFSTYSGGPSATYQWYDCINGNSPIAGATQASYTSAINGLFSVTVTENGCETSSSCAALVSASIDENLNNSVSVFPNPTEDMVFIAAEGLDIQQVELISITGKLVLAKEGQINSLSLQGMAKGTYILRITSTQGVVLKKIWLN